MEDIFGLGDVFEDEEPFSLLPPQGTAYLGLDISKTSTGVALLTSEGFSTDTITLRSKEPKEHLEEVLRRELRDKLIEMIGEGSHLTGIAVEDVYTGSNTNTIRTLYSLNTVIDGILLDGIITCDKFQRLHSGAWRKVLKQAVPEASRSINGKVFAQDTLAMYGIEVEGKGAQDQLDAIGIAMSNYLTPYNGGSSGLSGVLKGTLPALEAIKSIYVNNKVELNPLLRGEDSQFQASYTRYLAKADTTEQGTAPTVVEYTGRCSYKSIREEMAGYPPYTIFYTPKKVHLGSLVTKLNLSPHSFGGFFAFWRTR